MIKESIQQARLKRAREKEVLKLAGLKMKKTLNQNVSKVGPLG